MIHKQRDHDKDRQEPVQRLFVFSQPQCCHSRATHVQTNLLGGGWTVVDEHQRGEDVGGQANDGDEVGGDPGRHSSHQPFPVTLHQRLQQGASRAAVPAGTRQEQLSSLVSSDASLKVEVQCCVAQTNE